MSEIEPPKAEMLSGALLHSTGKENRGVLYKFRSFGASYFRGKSNENKSRKFRR